MQRKQILLVLLGSLIIPYLTPALYAYFPNDLELIDQLKVKQERIRYSENKGDTSIFETNLYDERSNLVQYKSKDNMPIQAKLVFHYNDENELEKVDYYRNHIFYQYRTVKRSKNKIIERFYSVTGKYKGYEQITNLDEQGREERITTKKKGQPKITKKFYYRDNGNLFKTTVKQGSTVKTTAFDENGERADKQDAIPSTKKILSRTDDGIPLLDIRTFKVQDILPKEVVKIGKGFQKQYSLEIYTHYFENGLNERTEICIEDHLMYAYFFDYTFHDVKTNDVVEIENQSSEDPSVQ